MVAEDTMVVNVHGIVGIMKRVMNNGIRRAAKTTASINDSVVPTYVCGRAS